MGHSKIKIAHAEIRGNAAFRGENGDMGNAICIYQ
jgi:hypothetical protein